MLSQLRKLAFVQGVLRDLSHEGGDMLREGRKELVGLAKKIPEKRLIAGAMLAQGYHNIGAGVDKAKEYHAGFYPGFGGQE